MKLVTNNICVREEIFSRPGTLSSWYAGDHLPAGGINGCCTGTATIEDIGCISSSRKSDMNVRRREGLSREGVVPQGETPEKNNRRVMRMYRQITPQPVIMQKRDVPD